MAKKKPVPFWRDPEHIKAWRAEYHPCDNGVHIFQPDGGKYGGLTVKNFPGATLEVFIKHSSADYNSDDFDLVCDLMEDGSIVKDCVIRRQDLALIERELESVT